MKKVAVIQDMSSFGKCSLTAAIPVLSVMGVQACPLPTAILTAQTAYDSYYCKDLTAEMPHFIEEWGKMNETFDGIHTGFVTGEQQIDHIMQFLARFQTTDTTVLVDPVMGDMGDLYKMYTSHLLERMRALVKQATIITPNITECCLLTGIPYEKLHNYHEEESFMKAVEEAGQVLHAQTGAQVIITGVTSSYTEKPSISNVVIDAKQSFYHKQPFNGQSYSGTGDLFASVVIGGLLRGQSLEETIKLAEQFLTAAIETTAKQTSLTKAGVYFEQHLGMLL